MNKFIIFNKTMLLIYASFICYGLQAQTTFTGNVTLTTQAEVETFGANNYTEITGSLTIQGADIDELLSLSTLTSVGGDLRILYNSILSNLDSLTNLTSVAGGVAIYDNAVLTKLDGLENITSVNWLTIYKNAVLNNLGGLTNLTSLGRKLLIGSNATLTNLDGLTNLTSVGGLDIDNNAALTNLDGLASLTSVGEVSIMGNAALTNLGGLANLTSISGSLLISRNAALTNFDGLANLTSVKSILWIASNAALTNLDGLTNLTLVRGDLKIVGNAALINLDGLANLTSVLGEVSIGGNAALTNLDGLTSLDSVGFDLSIINNATLTSFCGLYPLMSTGFLQSYAVSSNAVNPTRQAIIDGGTCISSIWDGSESSDWHIADNWDTGEVPRAVSNVIIPEGLSNYPTITAAALCNNLTLKSGASSIASLLGQTSLTVNGILNVERFISANQCHLVSTPTWNQNIDEFLFVNTNIPTQNVEGTDRRGMMDYNTELNDWNSFFESDNTDTILPFVGYSLRTDADGIVNFEGVLDQRESFSNSGLSAGWWCTGNPYPSAICINTAADAINNFIDLNLSEFEPSFTAIYVWEQGNNSYAIVNKGDEAFYGPLGQGFMVKVIEGSDIHYNTTLQTHAPSAVFKSGAVSVPEIKLIATTDEASSSTKIKFNEIMSLGLDVGYDAGMFKTDFNLYTQLVEDNGVGFGVQYLPYASLDNEEIALGLESKKGGEVTFSSELTNIPYSCLLTLEDRLNEIFTRLNDGDVYTAQLGTDAQAKGRFYLHTSNSITSVAEGNTLSEFKVYNSKSKIYIKGHITGKLKVVLYDIMGRKVKEMTLEQAPLNTMSTSDIKTGIYLLHIQHAGGVFAKKIPVN